MLPSKAAFECLNAKDVTMSRQYARLRRSGSTQELAKLQENYTKMIRILSQMEANCYKVLGAPTGAFTLMIAKWTSWVQQHRLEACLGTVAVTAFGAGVGYAVWADAIACSSAATCASMCSHLLVGAGVGLGVGAALCLVVFLFNKAYHFMKEPTSQVVDRISEMVEELRKIPPEDTLATSCEVVSWIHEFKMKTSAESPGRFHLAVPSLLNL